MSESTYVCVNTNELTKRLYSHNCQTTASNQIKLNNRNIHAKNGDTKFAVSVTIKKTCPFFINLCISVLPDGKQKL